VNREQLHCAGLGLFRPWREIVAPLCLAKPAEKAGKIRKVDNREIPGERVEKRLAVGPATLAVLVREHLDVELEFLLDDRHKIEQIEPGTRPDSREDTTSIPQPLEPDVAEAREFGVTFSRGGDEVERVDDRAALALGHRVS